MKQLTIRKRGKYGEQRLVVANVPKKSAVEKSSIRLTINHDQDLEWSFFLTEEQAIRLCDWLDDHLTN